MYIDYISIKNFRQYRDTKIEFGDPNEEGHITVIEGENGSGKSNLLNALTWCFFEKEFHTRRQENKTLPIINLSALEEMNPNSIMNVEVEVCLRTEDSRYIFIQREAKFLKPLKGKPRQLQYDLDIKRDTKLDVRVQKGRDSKREMAPTAFIHKLLPPSLSNYFFFDGERLDTYFEDQSTAQIEEGIKMISQISLLEKAINHLEKLESDLDRSFPDPSEELNQLQIQRRQEKNEQKELAEKKKNSEKIISELDKKIEKIDQELNMSNVTAVRNLHKERRRLEIDIKKNQDGKKSSSQERVSAVFKNGPAALLLKAILDTRKLVANAEEKGKLPAPIKKNFLEKLLEDEECICGSALTEGSDSRRKVQHLYDTSDLTSDYSNDISKTDAELRHVVESLPRTYTRLLNYRRKIKDLETDLEENQKRLKEVETLIGDTNIDEVDKKEKKRQELKKDHDIELRNLVRFEEKIKSLSSSLASLGSRITKSAKKDEKYKNHLLRAQFLAKVIDEAKRIRGDIIDSIREEVEDRTCRYFKELVWKKESFQDVKITKDYDIKVEVASDLFDDASGSLSAGEGQVLTLAFMCALTSVSGFDMPVIIDTPTSRISGTPRKSIARSLGEFMSGRQIILLMTDVEYTEEFRTQLGDSVGREYKIHFEDSAGTNSKNAWIEDYPEKRKEMVIETEVMQ